MTNNDFINRLKLLNMSKKEFSLSSKIPYNTITGWNKKGNKIPDYVSVMIDLMLDINDFKIVSKHSSVIKKLPAEPIEIRRAKKLGYRVEKKEIIIEVNKHITNKPLYVRDFSLVRFV